MKKLLVMFALLILASSSSYGATIDFSDDDPTQYFTINQTQSPPTGSELHLWVSGTNTNSFIDLGIVPFGVEITIIQGGLTGLAGNTLTINHTSDYWMYTQYSLVVDANQTLFGVPSDTVHFTVTAPTIPPGEMINVVVDK
jgi:hypothetical protein